MSRPSAKSCTRSLFYGLALIISCEAARAGADAPTDQASAGRPPAAGRSSFRDLLASSAIELSSLASIPASPISEHGQRELIERILYRLDRVDSRFIENALVPSDPQRLAREEAVFRGELVELRGRIVELDRFRPGGPASAGEAARPLFRCILRLGEPVDAAGGTATVWTAHVPAAWAEAERLNERAAAHGVFTGVANGLGKPPSLVMVASRIAWHPDDAGQVETPFGHRILGDCGVDVGLLAELRHALPLTSHDREPFYQLLAAVRRLPPRDLHRHAQGALVSYARPWQDEKAAAIRRLESARRQLASPGLAGEQQAASQPELRQARQREVLANVVLNAAAAGQYSVAPLFLDAENQSGQLLRLEGIARRAVRIEVDPDSRPTSVASHISEVAASAHKPEHYFELEVFTPDSQDLPVVCCTPSLPAGFPLGDDIREDVRVAGFFFKKWRYDSRVPRETGSGPLQFEPTAAPLLIASITDWTLSEREGSIAELEWLVGGIFVALIASACLGISWWTWTDRRHARLVRQANRPAEPIHPPAPR